MCARVDRFAVIGAPPEQRGFDGVGVAPVISDSCRVEAFVTVDAGTERPTTIGRRTWLMKKVHVGHDAIVGDDCELTPGVVVCGFVEIGAGVKVGVNACILPYRRVGAGARIGAGAVVTRDVPAGETWVGNPARKLEDHERDPRPHTERGPDPVDHDALDAEYVEWVKMLSGGSA